MASALTTTQPFDVCGFVLSRSLERIALGAGEKLFLKGDAAHGMYVVVSGRVDILIFGRVLDTIGPGGIIGEMALIDCTHRSAAALAQEDCELVALDRAQFLELIAEEPRFALAVIAIMSRRVARVAEMIRSSA